MLRIFYFFRYSHGFLDLSNSLVSYFYHHGDVFMNFGFSCCWYRWNIDRDFSKSISSRCGRLENRRDYIPCRKCHSYTYHEIARIAKTSSKTRPRTSQWRQSILTTNASRRGKQKTCCKIRRKLPKHHQ